jgi:hypothetical protein
MLTDKECRKALHDLWIAVQSVRKEMAGISADPKKRVTKGDIEWWMLKLYSAEQPLLERIPLYSEETPPPDDAA